MTEESRLTEPAQVYEGIEPHLSFRALRASLGQSMLAQYNLSMSIRHLAVAVLLGIKGKEPEVVAELEKIHKELAEANEHLRQSIEMADIAVEHAGQ